MLPPSAGQLLYFLATTSLLALKASADSTIWLFPAYVPNAPPITFESQDTIDAAWTSAFVAPLLVLFCQTNNDNAFSISKSIFCLRASFLDAVIWECCDAFRPNLASVITDEKRRYEPDFQSPAPVLPNGSYAIPLDSVQTPNQHCHLNLNETNGPLMGTGNSSNSGNFLVDDQYVLFRPPPRKTNRPQTFNQSVYANHKNQTQI